MVAGVVPDEGEMFTPAWPPEIAKSVRLPPGSEMTNVCFIAVRLQKLDWTSRSSTEVVSRFALFNDPTGRTITPLSEMAYIVEAEESRSARPIRFSGTKIL